MLDILLDTLLDCLKLLPFLYLTYLLMEFLEHRASASTEKMIRQSGRFGPLAGGILGALPQCGFSASAAGLFSTGLISIGTLIAVFLSTSDEMLPILLTQLSDADGKVTLLMIVKILSIKILVGILCGYILDGIFKLLHKMPTAGDIDDVCEKEHCHCENGIFRSALHHTLHILLFLLIIILCLNSLIYFIGEDTLSGWIQHSGILSVLIAPLVGLIPNCAASVVITELFCTGVLSAGAMIGGLLTGSGVGILILFRQNRSLRTSLGITAVLYGVGVLSGLLIDLTPLGSFLAL